MKKHLFVFWLALLCATPAWSQQQPTPVAVFCWDVGTTQYVKCENGNNDTDDGSLAAGQDSVLTLNLNHVYNGTTWARILSAVNALNSTGAGLQATQLVGQYDDTSPQTVTENQFGNLRMSSQGVLYNQIRDAAGNGRGANVNASNELNVALSSLPALAAGSNNIGDVDVLTINGQAPAFGSGTRSASTQRVTVATDDVVPASQSGTWTVQPGNTANTTPWLFSRQPATSGGLSITRTVAAASDNATNVKSSAGQVYKVIAANVNAAARYVHLYNASGTPTCNTSIIATFIVPGGSAGAGTNINLDPGVAFGTGIGFCITTGADGTGSVTAGDVILSIAYK